jgi:hypothetical protein
VASLAALKVDRREPVARAMEFDWQPVCEQFMAFLVPARRAAATQSSRQVHTMAQ